MNNKISILIPTYKSKNALDLCIRSCVEGCDNLKNIEILIGVDGTFEICKEILDKWKQYIKTLILEENVGLSRTTNLLVYNASYDLILILNDDNVALYRYSMERSQNSITLDNRIAEKLQ